ncbi:MAG: ASCH domain-containing protein [Clostridia bacterium]|nr:ASCH domain-containing protein [Clostridia bacterium]
MNAAEMWKLYGGTGKYGAWCFGEDPDGLAALVKASRKTATSSAYPVYAMEGEPLPKEGEYSVVMDSQDNAVCVIRNTRVRIVPFDQVTAYHARREGEGDLSLDYWRQVHRAFFSREMQSVHLVFDEKMPVVCEEFEKVYPKEEA